LGEALLLQAATAGIGNVYKSEVLHLEGLDPFAPVSAFAPQELERVLVTARRLMQRNVAGPPGPGAPLRRVFQKAPDPFAPRRRTTRFDGEGERLWVYGRRGQPCFRCQGTIEMARQGEQLRSTYHCRSCQPPRAAGTPKTAPPCPTVGNCNDI
jgi:endonuclease-8